MKNNAENDTTYDENISFNEKASKVLNHFFLGLQMGLDLGKLNYLREE